MYTVLYICYQISKSQHTYISILNQSLYHLLLLQPSNETSDKFDGCLPVQGLQNNKKPQNKKHYTHHSKRHHHVSEQEVEAPSLILAPPPQSPYHSYTDNGYLQLPFPEFMMSLPDINTIFDAQGLANYLPDISHLTDSQSQSCSPYQSPQPLDFSLNFYNPNSLDKSSLSSMTSNNKLDFNPQSTYKQCIPGHLSTYEDIQYIHYKSPLPTIQQPIMSHQQDYFAIPTLPTSN